MNSFFEPDPVVLAFFFAKKFLWLELLALLALLRGIVGRGPSRLAALTALTLCIAGIVTSFAPALGLTGPVYARAAQVMAISGGMVAVLVPSAVLGLSAVLPGARWRWIDAVHGLALIGFLGVWWWIS